MALTLKKKEGITGLNTGHALYSKVSRFITFGSTIKCWKNGTTYTSSATTVTDDDLGEAREFKANADVVTPTVPVPFPSTVVLIYKHTGVNTGGTTSDSSMLRLSGGDTFIISTGSWSAYDYRISRRGNFGTSYNTDYKPYAGSVALKNVAHATAVDYASGESTFYTNGSVVSVFGGTAAPTFTPSISTINCSVGAVVGTTGSFMLSGMIVFNTQLTDAEKASITEDPWALIDGTLPLGITFSKSTMNPGDTITATLANYTVAPTNAVITDVKGSTLTLPLTEIAALTSYTFKLPDLPTSNSSIPFVWPGAIDVTIGAKTVTTNFAVPIGDATWTYNLESVVLSSPVDTTLFETWAPDYPVTGDMLLTEGSFDEFGNFTGAEHSTSYKSWIIKQNSIASRFLVTTSSGVTDERDLPKLHLTLGGKAPVVNAGLNMSMSKIHLTATSKSMNVSSGVALTIMKRHLNTAGKAMSMNIGGAISYYSTIIPAHLSTSGKVLSVDASIKIPVLLTLLAKHYTVYGKQPSLQKGHRLTLLNKHYTLNTKPLTLKQKNQLVMIMVSRMYNLK